MADNNILASNLAQLGGQIAATFQNVALQNQYKNSLPAMQQVFQQSMTDFDSGRSGAGFARIMDVAMQNPNNPYIQNMAQMAFRAGQLASDDYFKRQQINLLQQKVSNAAQKTTTGTSPADLISALNRETNLPEEEQIAQQVPSVAAMAGARGQQFPFKQVREQQASRLGATEVSPQSTMEQLEGPLPTQLSAGAGLLKPAEKEKALEMKFASNVDKFASMPLDQKIIEDDGTSLTFENEDEINKFIKKSKKDPASTYVPISKAAQLALPGVTGFVIPKEYSKWAEKGYTINSKGGISYTIGKEDLNTPESKKAKEWIDSFNDAAISADSNPKLRKLLSSAGGVLNLEWQPITDEKLNVILAKGGKPAQTYQANVRGSNQPPVELTKEEVQTLETLNSKTAAMSVMGAKALRSKSQIAKAEPEQPVQKNAGQKKDLKVIFAK